MRHPFARAPPPPPALCPLEHKGVSFSIFRITQLCKSLHPEPTRPTEYIVAKAIRDGGIDAVLDAAGGFMASRDRADVYSSAEPQAAFHARIAFCLDLHNEAIKAMRFDPDAHRWLGDIGLGDEGAGNWRESGVDG